MMDTAVDPNQPKIKIFRATELTNLERESEDIFSKWNFEDDFHIRSTADQLARYVENRQFQPTSFLHFDQKIFFG